MSHTGLPPSSYSVRPKTSLYVVGSTSVLTCICRLNPYPDSVGSNQNPLKAVLTAFNGPGRAKSWMHSSRATPSTPDHCQRSAARVGSPSMKLIATEPTLLSLPSALLPQFHD
ncbi:hypothetical protein [Chiayiivirga flava]|uniref:Uncharacterized protein n=1 Tax=Chiayiivirga flava TaxID=659595 RepID=A0A7W8G1K2_9GAMM|nr:hypothetical protein [Chiayiivirga flava]MBB5209514.1 hypothetical protein [Chiayiivirga flava]